MPTTLHDEAAIVGIGQTEFSKNSGRSELQLTAEAIRAALDDCGLQPSDVDGMTTFTLDTTDEIEAARAVGIGDLTFFNRIPHGGGAAIGVVQHAAMAVATGIANVVVCYRGLNGRSGQRYSAGVAEGVATSDLIHWSWYMPYGLMTPASWVAMFTQRYMYEYGAEANDLAEVALATREHAVTNPAAFFHQRPLTLDDYFEARWIAEPLRLYDCCQETDGACAAIVTSVERAKDLKQKPAIIRGAAQAAGADQESMTSFYRPSICTSRKWTSLRSRSTRSRASARRTSTLPSSTTRSRRSCSGRSSRSASAGAARRRTSSRAVRCAGTAGFRPTRTAASSARPTSTA